MVQQQSGAQPRSLPGFTYDTITNRYYRIGHEPNHVLSSFSHTKDSGNTTLSRLDLMAVGGRPLDNIPQFKFNTKFAFDSFSPSINFKLDMSQIINFVSAPESADEFHPVNLRVGHCVGWSSLSLASRRSTCRPNTIRRLDFFSKSNSLNIVEEIDLEPVYTVLLPGVQLTHSSCTSVSSDGSSFVIRASDAPAGMVHAILGSKAHFSLLINGTSFVSAFNGTNHVAAIDSTGRRFSIGARDNQMEWRISRSKVRFLRRAQCIDSLGLGDVSGSWIVGSASQGIHTYTMDGQPSGNLSLPTGTSAADLWGSFDATTIYARSHHGALYMLDTRWSNGSMTTPVIDHSNAVGLAGISNIIYEPPTKNDRHNHILSAIRGSSLVFVWDRRRTSLPVATVKCTGFTVNKIRSDAEGNILLHLIEPS